MQVDVKSVFDFSEQVFEIIDTQVEMVPALEKDLPSSQGDGFFNFLRDGFEGQDVGVAVSFFSVKSAKCAVCDTNVGIVDVAVDDVGDDSFGAFFPHETGSYVAQQGHVCNIKEA